jgi:acetyl esterase/lipase
MPSLSARIVYRILHNLPLRVLANTPVGLQRSRVDRWGWLFINPGGVTTETTWVGPLESDWIYPPKADPGRVVLYLHGGGYMTGSRGTHRSLAAEVAVAGRAQALLIEYRLSPENKFPGALDDALFAYRWLLERGTDPQKLSVAGDSAGGGLTMALMIAARDQGLPLPASAVLFSPWTDLAGTGSSYHRLASVDPMLSPEGLDEMAAAYAGTEDLRHPLISPLYADLHGLPPVLIQVGGNEILLDDSVRLAQAIQQAGGQVRLQLFPNMWHVFQFFGGWMRESRQAVVDTGDFLCSSWKDC